jgi:hypothetical protein
MTRFWCQENFLFTSFSNITPRFHSVVEFKGTKYRVESIEYQYVTNFNYGKEEHHCNQINVHLEKI